MRQTSSAKPLHQLFLYPDAKPWLTSKQHADWGTTTIRSTLSLAPQSTAASVDWLAAILGEAVGHAINDQGVDSLTESMR